MSTPPGLGPHLIGSRVVVRRVVRGETGPSGGPAFTDLLGVMESWGAGVATVRAESGEVTEIEVADIVSGKAVPPRPPVRLRVSAEDAERRANASWPALEAVPLGDWLLRASGGFSARANSALAVGDPGMPTASALARVTDFYLARGLPSWAQVIVGSDLHRQFDEQGWVRARPGEADTAFQLASVARALRAVRRTLPPVLPHTSLSPTADERWLAGDSRARDRLDAALGVLEGPEEVGFARFEEGGVVVARGRVAASGDWAGITDVWVAAGHRRRGLGAALMAVLLEWAAERGATTAYLQTRGDNPAALAMYERLGFLTHHEYRYLTPA